jgi:hypothetical protein
MHRIFENLAETLLTRNEKFRVMWSEKNSSYLLALKKKQQPTNQDIQWSLQTENNSQPIAARRQGAQTP